MFCRVDLSSLPKRLLWVVLDYVPRNHFKTLMASCKCFKAICTLKDVSVRLQRTKEAVESGDYQTVADQALVWQNVYWPSVVEAVNIYACMHYDAEFAEDFQRPQDLICQLAMDHVFQARAGHIIKSIDRSNEYHFYEDTRIDGQKVTSRTGKLNGSLYVPLSWWCRATVKPADTPFGPRCAASTSWLDVCQQLQPYIDQGSAAETKIVEAKLPLIGEGQIYIYDSAKSRDRRLKTSHLRFLMNQHCQSSFYLFLSYYLVHRSSGIEITGFDKRFEGAKLVLPERRYSNMKTLKVSNMAFGSIDLDCPLVDDHLDELSKSTSQSPLTEQEELALQAELLEAEVDIVDDEENDDHMMPKAIRRITAKHFPALEHLMISNNHEVESIYNLPKLKSLELEDCQGLSHIGQNQRLCASLVSIKLKHCNQLHHELEPDGRHRKLKRLVLQDMESSVITKVGLFRELEELVLIACPEIEEVEKLPKLKCLRIDDCPYLRFGDVTGDRFPCIEKVQFRDIGSLHLIDSCPNLIEADVQFDPEDGHLINNLRAVSDCPNLVQLTVYPPKNSLIIKRCPRLRGWESFTRK